MDIGLVVRALALRRVLRRHDRWSRAELQAHQQRALDAVRRFAYRHSPFYRDLHRGLERRPLSELPVVTKARLMESFDCAVTDPLLSREAVERHVGGLRGDQLLARRYRICGTGGTTGKRGLFPFDRREWATVIASYARTYEWAGTGPDLMHATAIVASTDPLHQSARVGASIAGPWMPVLRLDALRPLDALVDALNGYRPATLVAYASMLDILARAALAGELEIAPRVVISASEVLADATRERVRAAWRVEAYDAYAATETATIASPCPEGRRSHLYEDLLIVEPVDDRDRPVPAGTVAAKLLVTVLFARTLPLIRYELGDRVSLESDACSCGRPYRVLGAIDGRTEDVIRMPGRDGRPVVIHPNAFHAELEQASVEAWQVVQDDARSLTLLVVPPREAPVQVEAMTTRIAARLSALGVDRPAVRGRTVPAIPKTALGKTRLVIGLP